MSSFSCLRVGGRWLFFLFLFFFEIKRASFFPSFSFFSFLLWKSPSFFFPLGGKGVSWCPFSSPPLSSYLSLKYHPFFFYFLDHVDAESHFLFPFSPFFRERSEVDTFIPLFSPPSSLTRVTPCGLSTGGNGGGTSFFLFFSGRVRKSASIPSPFLSPFR